MSRIMHLFRFAVNAEIYYFYCRLLTGAFAQHRAYYTSKLSLVYWYFKIFLVSPLRIELSPIDFQSIVRTSYTKETLWQGYKDSNLGVHESKSCALTNLAIPLRKFNARAVNHRVHVTLLNCNDKLEHIWRRVRESNPVTCVNRSTD